MVHAATLTSDLIPCLPVSARVCHRAFLQPIYGANTGHQIYLISQGIIHHTLMALSELGKQRDIDVVKTLYQEDEWLAGLSSRNLTSIWQKRWFPHNYEVTAFEAYMDMYIMTGNRTYLDAVTGAWEMFRSSFIHVGGSMAINEGSIGMNLHTGLWYPPKSYYLEAPMPSHAAWYLPKQGQGQGQGQGFTDDKLIHVTGETCGSVFWIKLNQRFHRLYPSDERYTAEIERSLLNIGIANQPPVVGAPVAGIRYFAYLHRHKCPMSNISTCCEGQGTRLHGSLPEYVFSTGPNKVVINLFVNASIQARLTGNHPIVVTMASNFLSHAKDGHVLAKAHIRLPDNRAVDTASGPGRKFTLSVRVPAWTAANHTVISLATTTKPRVT